MFINLVRNNITSIKADCYINPVNTKFEVGSVGKLIFHAAGNGKLKGLCDKIGGCSIGHVAITPGLKTKAIYILHASVLDNELSAKEYEAALVNSYKEALNMAMELNCHSIAMPVLGIESGVLELNKTLEIALDSIYSFKEKYLGYDFKIFIAEKDQKLCDIIATALENRLEKENEKFGFGVICFANQGGLNEVFGSQYKCSFQIEGIKYSSVTQYMSAKKCVLFDDVISLTQVKMASVGPASIEITGKNVKYFNKGIWDAAKYEIAYNANYAKFSQNEELKSYLLSTGDCILAETDTGEEEWGIGLESSSSDATDVNKWRGKNLSGQILMQIRDRLRNELE